MTGWCYTSFSVVRVGTCDGTCNADGSCTPPPEEPDDCKEGDLFPARGADSPIITGGDGSKIVSSFPPTDVCYGSCSYAGVQGETRSSGCYISSADSSQGYCNYIIKGTGQSCSAEKYQLATSGEPLNPPPDPDAPPPILCPPGWGVSGTTCHKLPSDPTDPTNPTDPTPGDGDGDGSGGGGGGGGGNDGGSGDGDSDGDGDGGDGGDDGSGGGGGSGGDSDEDGTSVGGEACDAKLSCEGDAVQCAILRQQKQLRCEAKEQADFDKKKGDIEGLFKGEEFELGTAEVHAPTFINAAARFLPSGCPTPESMSLRSNGGRTLQIKYEPLCQAATDMSWLIVAFTSLFAAVYVGRAFGGS